MEKDDRLRLGRKPGQAPAATTGAESERLLARYTQALNKNIGARSQNRHPTLSPDQLKAGARIVVARRENAKSNPPTTLSGGGYAP